jgi:hypothetical protein
MNHEHFMRFALKQTETVLLCGEFQIGSVPSQHDSVIAAEFWKGA